ncbi:thiamine-phosphate kinase [Candidatus Sumerlaeota bacterium]|nr:thiamine-phosphate kinase [Candidatus Sumerlaeota bacterium]
MSDETLSTVGELGLLELLKPLLQRHTAGLPLGTGDDVAVTAHDGAQRLAWTIDSMVEGTHFRWWNDPLATPEALGYKLVATNASDLASKAARPLFALVSLGVPAGESARRIHRFYDGIDQAFSKFGGRLIGGDTVRAPQWSLTLALVGEVAADAPIAARDRARPEQTVYITGPVGDSAAGLAILEGRLSVREPERSELVNAHLRPAVDVARGIELVQRHRDIAMMDVSDGVVNDCGQLARASGVCIDIYTNKLPLSGALLSACAGDRARAEHFALHGGEDYRLLFSTALAAASDPPGFPIGKVGSGGGVAVVDPHGVKRPANDAGFSHFS